ncbi:MAG: hypothetical protein AAFY71_21230 [Bacteroidota bacterium]
MDSARQFEPDMISFDNKVSSEEAGMMLGMKASAISKLCREGAFKGAAKEDRKWLIPVKSIKKYAKANQLLLHKLEDKKAEKKEISDKRKARLIKIAGAVGITLLLGGLGVGLWYLHKENQKYILQTAQARLSVVFDIQPAAFIRTDTSLVPSTWDVIMMVNNYGPGRVDDMNIDLTLADSNRLEYAAPVTDTDTVQAGIELEGGEIPSDSYAIKVSALYPLHKVAFRWKQRIEGEDAILASEAYQKDPNSLEFVHYVLGGLQISGDRVDWSVYDSLQIPLTPKQETAINP